MNRLREIRHYYGVYRGIGQGRLYSIRFAIWITGED